MEFRDLASGQPLLGVRLRDDAGSSLSLTPRTEGRPHEYTLEMTTTTGDVDLPLRLEIDGRTLDMDAVLRPDEDTVTLFLPVFAMVELELKFQGVPRSVPEPPSARIRVVSCPPLVDLPVERRTKSLELTRDRDPFGYADRVRRLAGVGVIEKDMTIEAPFSRGITLAWSGECAFSVSAPHFSPRVERMNVRQGERQRLPVTLVAPTIVSGRITLRDGSPARGVELRLSCQTDRNTYEPIQHAAGHPGGTAATPGWIVIHDAATASDTMLMMLRAETAPDGSFEFETPFTHHVALYAFVAGFDRVDFRRTAPPLESITGIELELVPSSGTSFMKVVDEQGDPIAKEKFTVSHADPIPVQEQIQYPMLMTDEEGRLPVGWLVDGVRYSISCHRGRRSDPFRVEVGREITVTGHGSGR